jgi:hypothetical protein
MNNDYAVLLRVTPRVEIPRRIPGELTSLVHADAPAVSAMTDFSEVMPVTIEPVLVMTLRS